MKLITPEIRWFLIGLTLTLFLLAGFAALTAAPPPPGTESTWYCTIIPGTQAVRVLYCDKEVCRWSE